MALGAEPQDRPQGRDAIVTAATRFKARVCLARLRLSVGSRTRTRRLPPDCLDRRRRNPTSGARPSLTCYFLREYCHLQARRGGASQAV